MPPNIRFVCEYEGIPQKNRGIVKIALPFDQPAYKNVGTVNQDEEPSAVYYQGTSRQEVADDDEDEPVVRITTRARFSYELDRFEKNVMLVINNSDADAEKTFYMLHAFQGHKFELSAIETEQDTREDIWLKIDRFFQQDFTNIGAVAVATLSCPDHVPERDNCVEEWDVMNYVLGNQPATILGKPKIFISESLNPSSPPEVSGLPNDVLLIQTKNIATETGVCPLDLLCHKLLSMQGSRDLLDLLSELSYEVNRAFPTPTSVISTCTFRKELWLQKDGVEEKSVENWITKLVDPGMFQIYWRCLMNAKNKKGQEIEMTPSEVHDALVEYNATGRKVMWTHYCDHQSCPLWE